MCNIAGAVQDADNDDFADVRKVIDWVFPVKDHAQIGSQMRAWSTGERKRRGLTESSLDLGKKFGCD